MNRSDKMVLLSTVTAELKMLAVTAAASKFTVPVGDEATVLVKKMTKVYKAIEAWISDPSSLKEKALSVLAQQYHSVMSEKKDLDAWVEKVGLGSSKKGKKEGSLKISKLRRIRYCCLKLRRSVALLLLEATTSSSVIETANYLYVLCWDRCTSSAATVSLW